MKKVLLLVISFFSIQFSFSQVFSGQAAEAIFPQANEVKIDQQTNSPVFISLTPGSSINIASMMESLKNLLGMNQYDAFRLEKMDSDELGMRHLRYQQMYKGLIVEMGKYFLHENNGFVSSANGLFYTIGALDINPVLSVESAFKAALKNINARKYLWQDPVEEALLRTEQNNLTATWLPKGTLVVFPGNVYLKSPKAVLCWKFDIYAIDPLSRNYIYVNATNGEIIYKENRICNIATTGTGNTKYNGTQSFTTDSVSANVFRLRDNSRGAVVETYNMQKGTGYGAAIDFTDADNVWTSVTNQDNAALDAHWGAEKTYDYYLAVHGRNSYDNAGSAMRSYVHYSNAYNNAFWDGVRMTYGDGDGTTFTALTELDVCGHELTHGVTANSSGLIYSNESGALNESFSDIFGKAIDFYVNPLAATWKIGAKCYTPGTAGDALRYMNNPNLAGNPDTYHGTSWYNGTADNGGVHTNSGVQNFWFYLLVSGGSGTNDVGFIYNVAGIGIEKARRIAYRNNTVYLSPSATYADAAFYALKSASDLFGICSPEAVSVKNAWDAVGVFGLQLNANAQATTIGATCLGGNVQLSASGGVSYSWSGPNGYISTLKSPVIANAAANVAGVYTCLVTDSNGCVGAPTIDVTINALPNINAGADVSICQGVAANLNAIAGIAGQGLNTGVNNTSLPIPDYPAAAVFSSININGATNANAVVTVIIDSLTHSYDGDLDIRLVAPNGSEIILVSGRGGAGVNYLHTIFKTGFTPIASGTAPFNGTFAPQQAFNNLTGSANGTWKLEISDLGGLDVGTLWKWSLSIQANAINAYSWSPATGLSNAAINNPSALPASTTAYIVTVTDVLGCSASDDVNVNVASPFLLASINNAGCGLSNGSINLTVTGLNAPINYSWSNGATTEDITAVAAGSYSVTVTNGSCSASGSFTVQTAGGNSPPTPLAIVGQSSACRNQSGIVYSVPVVAGATSYNWTLPTGVTGSSSTESIALNFGPTFSGGNVCVSAVNICGSSVPLCKPLVLLTTAPSTPASISGITTACSSSTQTYTVLLDNNATIYNWTIPANTSILSGAGTNSIQLSFNSSWVSGSLTVSSGNCIGNSSNRTLALRSLPATPSSITGDRLAVCAGTTHPYTAPAATGATSYSWTFPAGSSITGQGTNSVQITFPLPFATGNVTVASQNVCGNSTAGSVSVRSVPSTPGTISGPLNNNCAVLNAVYSVAASTTGATGYTWVVPAFATIASGQNTNSLHVNFTGTGSGTISVSANNTCGSSASRTLSGVTTLPARPASISGTSTVCLNQTGIPLSVVSQAGVNYNWTVPSGATITSGQTTANVTANWGSVAGNVAVVATNSCGSAASRTKAITINCRIADIAQDEISLYPNPVNDLVTLQVNNASDHQYIYEVYDMIGKKLLSKEISIENNEINVSAFANGVYLVQLRNENGLVKALKMVIQ